MKRIGKSMQHKWRDKAIQGLVFRYTVEKSQIRMYREVKEQRARFRREFGSFLLVAVCILLCATAQASIILQTLAGTGKNIYNADGVTMALVDTYQPSVEQYVAVQCNLTNLNGAAASISLRLEHTTSADVLKASQRDTTTYAKYTAASTAYGGRELGPVLLAATEKLKIYALSTNSSDTNASYSIDILNLKAGDILRIAGKDLPAESVAGNFADSFGAMFDVAAASRHFTTASYNQGADSNTILADATNGNAAIKTAVNGNAPYYIWSYGTRTITGGTATSIPSTSADAYTGANAALAGNTTAPVYVAAKNASDKADSTAYGFSAIKTDTASTLNYASDTNSKAASTQSGFAAIRTAIGTPQQSGVAVTVPASITTNLTASTFPSMALTTPPPTTAQIQARMEDAGTILNALYGKVITETNTHPIATDQNFTGLATGTNVTNAVSTLSGDITSAQSAIISAMPAAPHNTQIDAVKVVTDILAGMYENVSGYRWNSHALMQSPGVDAVSIGTYLTSNAPYLAALGGAANTAVTTAHGPGSYGTAGISGTVVWPYNWSIGGVPVIGASVTVTTDSAGLNYIQSGVTNDFGNVVIAGSSAGFILNPNNTYYFWRKGGTCNGKQVSVSNPLSQYVH